MLTAEKAASERRLAVRWGLIVLIVGLALRCALVLSRYPQLLEKPEPVAIAISLVTTGRYADAYGSGVGPTAHCAPLLPLLLSVLIRIFGAGSGAALAISFGGSTAAAIAFALLPTLAEASGLHVSTGVLAGLAGALVPVNFWSQTSGSFDAPYSAAALVALCLLVFRIWTSASFTLTTSIVLGLAAGLACLLNFAFLPVLILWALLFLVRFRRQFPRVLTLVGIAALCFIAALAPWATRNRSALGAWIWTRSDFGLELSQSNNDVLTADEEYNVRTPAFRTTHPFFSETEREKVRQLGEVNYERARQRQALLWISSHKPRFLRLTLQRSALIWAPRMNRAWQTAIEVALTIAALIGLALLFRSCAESAWIFGAVLAGYPSVYYIVEVSPRYRFPIEPVLFLLAAVTFTRLVMPAFSSRQIHRKGIEPR